MPDQDPPITYADILRQLQDLTPEQLAQPVRWSSDCSGGLKVQVYTLKEDHVVMDDYLEPESSYSEEELEDAVARVPAGTVYFDCG
jgi:hypothetical protein